jgi:hypothetical protein
MRVGGAVAPYAMKLMGMGDYTVSGNRPERNSLFTNGNYQFNKGGFTISNREYIGDVVSGTPNSFNYNVYALNPG